MKRGREEEEGVVEEGEGEGEGEEGEQRSLAQHQLHHHPATEQQS